jgi:membrane fusion protein (multidrug efflux system)
MDTAAQPAPRALRTRTAVLLRPLLLWGVPLLVVGTAAYLYGSAGRYVSTDNAYLQQDRVDVAPQVSGDVREVLAAENQAVTAGQPVLVLDDAQLRIAATAAESRLGTARAEVAGGIAAWREKAGELAVAQATAEYATRELHRQQELAARKLAPASLVDSAHRSADLATGAIDVLKLQLAQATARLGGNPNLPVDAYGPVRLARAELDRVQLDLSHTILRAPQAGIVSHLPKVGSRVDTGRPALAVVVAASIWVEANFKETELEWVRAGQPVAIEVDTYPHARWRGRVASISQATGAEFSLLPPQNASGNWVKVVQRIPVRIALEPLANGPPLRDGMSVTAKIDTGPHSRFDRWLARVR